jgi:deoxyribodipyrimidine photolyase-related protein
MQTLRLILGDQLNQKHSWFKNPDDTVVYVMAELSQETDYVLHHIQKVVGFSLRCATLHNGCESIAIA